MFANAFIAWIVISLILLSISALYWSYLKRKVKNDTIVVQLGNNVLECEGLWNTQKFARVTGEFSHTEHRLVANAGEFRNAIEDALLKCLSVPSNISRSSLGPLLMKANPYVVILCRESLSPADMYTISKALYGLVERYRFFDNGDMTMTDVRKHVLTIQSN